MSVSLHAAPATRVIEDHNPDEAVLPVMPSQDPPHDKPTQVVRNARRQRFDQKIGLVRAAASPMEQSFLSPHRKLANWTQEPVPSPYSHHRA